LLQRKAKLTSNWLLGDFTRMLNVTNTDLKNAKATPRHIADLIELVDAGAVSGPSAKAVFEEMFLSGKAARDIIAEKGLSQISDTTEIETIVIKVIAENMQAVADFKTGKEQSLTFLIGQIMRVSKGRANPGLVRTILLDKLGGN
jgi:aspartyl-tRNA(Asn)/glutamyl-tRNA(Gln) amidotransferase subunit B